MYSSIIGLPVTGERRAWVHGSMADRVYVPGIARSIKRKKSIRTDQNKVKSTNITLILRYGRPVHASEYAESIVSNFIIKVYVQKKLKYYWSIYA